MTTAEERLVDRLGVLGEELVAEIRRLNHRLDSSADDRTSVKIETGAKRELKATVHVYAGDTDQAANTWLVEEAIRLHTLAQAHCDGQPTQ